MRVKHANGLRYFNGHYQWALAPAARINGGAEEMVFEMPTTLPLLSFIGPARNAGQMILVGEAGVVTHAHGAAQGLPQTFSPFELPFQDSMELNSVDGPQ